MLHYWFTTPPSFWAPWRPVHIHFPPTLVLSTSFWRIDSLKSSLHRFPSLLAPQRTTGLPLRSSAAQNHDVAPADDAQNAQITFFAQFLRFLASNVDSSAPHTSVLSSALQQFTTQCLSVADIHTLTASFTLDACKEIITGYFAALAVLESHIASTEDIPCAPQSALLNTKSGKAPIHGIFGGQGTNEVYFTEFRALYETYKPYVTRLVTPCRQRSSHSRCRQSHQHQWLQLLLRGLMYACPARGNYSRSF